MRFTKQEIFKECFAFDVSGYSDWIDRETEMIADLVAGAPTLESLIPMMGAKAGTTVELNRISTDVTWQGGSCVTDSSGTTTLAPRVVEVKRVTDREELCLDDIDAKLGFIQSAGANNQDLPFAEVFMGLKIANNSKQLEKLAWRGSLTGGTGNLALADGWIEKAKAETGDLASFSTFSGMSSLNTAGVIAQMRAVLSARTDEMRERNDVVIYLAPGDFEIVANAIVDTFGIAGTGLYVNSGSEIQLGEVQQMFWPGSSVKVKATHGLSSNNSIFSTYEENLRYVTDLQSDMEVVDLFFDKKSRALISDIIFAIGFNYNQPEHVIYVEKV